VFVSTGAGAGLAPAWRRHGRKVIPLLMPT
jgi:hypothetical protein